MPTTQIVLNKYVAGSPVAPWLIEIDPGVSYWPSLHFPFVMSGAGTDEGERVCRAAAKAALKATVEFYKHDDEGIFSPEMKLIGPNGDTVHGIELRCDKNGRWAVK